MSETPTIERMKTSYTETELICPKCKARWSPVVANFVNFETDPVGKEGMLRKTMHHAYCPACKFHVEVDHIFSIYDPEVNTVVQVRPKWEFKAGGGEEMYWTRLEQLLLKWADQDVKVDVVFGYDELIEKYLGGEEAVAAAMRRNEQEKSEGLESGTIAKQLAADRTGSSTA